MVDWNPLHLIGDAENNFDHFLKQGAGDAVKAATGINPNDIVSTIDATYRQVTKVSMWRSVGWITLGMVAATVGIIWWVKTEGQDTLEKIASGKAHISGLASPILPLGLTGIGVYLIWFGVEYWEDTTVIWPSDPIKAVLIAGKLPPRNADLSAQQLLNQDEQNTTAAPAPNSQPGSPNSTAGTETQNELSVAQYLMKNGYSRAAAAGIAGTIAGESNGNPEAVGSGGAGLIGWTPPDKARPDYPIVTGNPTKDLDAQMRDILAYNEGWAQYLPMLNAQTDPVAAADFYSKYFERPAVTYSDVRPNVAINVYDQLGGSEVPVK